MRPNFRQMNQFLVSFSTKQLIVLAVIVCCYWAYTWWNISSLERRSSAQLKEDILRLSEHYVRALAREHKDVVDGPYSGRLTAYDLKRTMAVLLQNILERLSKLEHRISNTTFLLVNDSSLIPLVLEADGQSKTAYRGEGLGRPAQTGRGVRSVGDAARSLLSRLRSSPSTAEGPTEVAEPKSGGGEAGGVSWCGLSQQGASLPNTMRSLWPECEEKLEWMRKHWRSDPCYSNYGVDGSECSFFFYLSEVESFCPRLSSSNAKKEKTNITINYVQPRSDGDELLNELATKARGPYADAFRSRLANFWALLLTVSQRLLGRGGLASSRPRLRISVFPTLLSNVSIKGTYLTQLPEETRSYLVRQWVELLGTIYLLGHEVTLCTSVEELKAVLRRFPDTRSPCQARRNLFLDLLYTDHRGLDLFRGLVGPAQYTRFSCLLRVLDPFGTDPAHNLRPFSNACPLCGARLQPRQYLTSTAADLTPDNSFLGHVVTPVRTLPVPAGSEGPLAVVHLTRHSPPPSPGLLSALRRHFRVVVASEDPASAFAAGAQPFLASEWRAGLGWTEFRRLLASASLLVGLGWPVDSPVALEALAVGCAVAVPLRGSPAPLDTLARGWPSSRPIVSQHGYLTRHVRPPYVLQLSAEDAGSTTELERRLGEWKEEAEARGRRLPPFVPPEFTAEAYLQRLDAFLRRQQLCEGAQGSRMAWPPATAVSFYLGVVGDSCEETCRKRGLICEPSHFSGINSRIELQERGLRCEKIAFDASPVLPYFLPGRDTCAFQSEPRLFSCTGSAPSAMRLCPCRDSLPGQSALCAQCL